MTYTHIILDVMQRWWLVRALPRRGPVLWWGRCHGDQRNLTVVLDHTRNGQRRYVMVGWRAGKWVFVNRKEVV